ncbi:MAG TPA: DUF5916 domain-containing protein [Longimicrobiaceae bacterium]|jgi:hypothetical protein|nr:DUF5916 domain-containing protein [Longimicrobiaceae bacterium]
MSLKRAVPPLAVLLALAGHANAQSAPAPKAAAVTAPQVVLGATRITGAAPTIDGKLDDAAWQQAPVATGFVQRAPNAGAPGSAPTEVRVLYGGDAVYVAARMHDRPDSIAAQLSRRDDGSTYSDWMYVMLDSDDGNRSAYVLGVNPREVQQDFIMEEDGTQDATWDAVWQVRTRVDSAGWTAEFRIPLSQLRYDPHHTVWGLNFQRTIARREEDDYWSPIPPDAAGFISRFGQLDGLVGLGSPTRLELNPYATSRVTRAPGTSTDPFYSRNSPSASAGVDMRYGLTPNMTLTATVNPDFGQVEADPSVVNLTAFETSFPEQRPFFVQDARIFQFKLGGSAGQLLYSRRIGAPPRGSVPGDAAFADVPERTTILGAVKLSGKTSNGWRIGVLDALTSQEDARFTTVDGTRGSSPVEPLANFGTVRVMKDLNGGASGLGAIVTTVNRRMQPGLEFLRSSAVAAGMDGRHRFGGGNYEMSGYLVGSNVRGSTEAITRTQRSSAHYFQRPGADYLGVDSTLTSLSGVIGDLELKKIGGGSWTWETGARARSPGLEINDLGFQNQTDRIEEYGGLGYSHYKAGSVFKNWYLHGFQRMQWTFGHERVQTYLNAQGSFQLLNYQGGSALVERYQPAISTSELRGGASLRTPGQTALTLSAFGDRRRKVTWSVLGYGALEDGTGGNALTIAPALELRPSPRMELSLEPTLAWNTVPAQFVDQADDDAGVRHYYFARLAQTTTALTARLSYTFTPRLSLQYYAQPFISAGRYSAAKEVADPAARSFDQRFRPATLSEQPDFNFKAFNSNAVMRWEYRPGSTLFVVWNSALQQTAADGSYDLIRDSSRLFRSDGTNVLLIKLSYWLGL